jgi:glutathione synthase/RimK-type ligase-like ATP-grasp enzyme
MPRTPHQIDQPREAGQPGERVLVAIVREVAQEMGLRVSLLGGGWIIRLARDSAQGSKEVVRHIHGYAFDLNPAATHAIACDKAATSEALSQAGLTCVPHELFLHPSMARFVNHAGVFEKLLTTWRSWECDVVLKDNTGTGGRDVMRCRSAVELEEAAMRLFTQTNAIACCPFRAVAHEHRFVILDGMVQLAYEKVRRRVVGDGRRAVLELLAADLETGATRPGSLRGLLEEMDAEQRTQLVDVPRFGEERVLNWRHNLGQGATARLLSPAESIALPQHAMALCAARVLGLRFGSVDIVTSMNPAANAPRHEVLEVNSGVMMEYLVRTQPDGPALATRIYREAITAMFAETA